MCADSTTVRSMGHLDDTSGDASSTSPTAPSAGTSADAAQARGSTDGPTIVGVRSGTVLDPKLVAVAARTDIAQRVLTILEPLRERSRQPQPADADADAPDGLECARWYRSSGATQRSGDDLPNELADNTTSRFLK